MHNVKSNKTSSKTNNKERRSRLEIAAEILEICRKPVTKTKIMYKTNTSHTGLLDLLPWLKETELLKTSTDGKKFEITEKGQKFLKSFAEISDLLTS
jgi:predicted transcriptional regulator